MLNVKSVIVGDQAYEVTCIVEVEGVEDGDLDDKKCEALEFRQGVYP